MDRVADACNISTSNYNAKTFTVLMDRVANADNTTVSTFNAKATTVLMDRVANANNTRASNYFTEASTVLMDRAANVYNTRITGLSTKSSRVIIDMLGNTFLCSKRDLIDIAQMMANFPVVKEQINKHWSKTRCYSAGISKFRGNQRHYTDIFFLLMKSLTG